jgi:ribosomal protein S1
MKRLLPLFVGILLAAAPALAQDKPAAKPEAKATSGKTMTAMGTVSAVAADSLTVKAKEGEMTFAVDSKTAVTSHGASHKSAEMKGENKATQITDFVKVGDEVSVKYHDMGATKHAASVTVKSTGAAPKK